MGNYKPEIKGLEIKTKKITKDGATEQYSIIVMEVKALEQGDGTNCNKLHKIS